jgi:hypothetical protein
MLFFDRVQKMIKTILSLIFALILGYSLTFLPFEFIPMRWEIWAGIAALSAIGLLVCLYLSRPEEKEPFFLPNDDLKEELDQFQREFKQALRGHLKVSILFWSYYYKKEKVKTLEEAKREVFQDLKKEFSQVRWMESLLEEIRQELIKYK